MKISNTSLLKLVVTLMFFLIVKVILSYTVLSSFNIISIDAQFSQDTVIKIFYSSGYGFQSEYAVSSPLFYAEKRVTHRIYLNNNVVRSLRIDPGPGKGNVKLYGLQMLSFYGDVLKFKPKDIYESFQPNSAIDSFLLEEDHVLITANTEDPYMISTKKMEVDNIFLKQIFPILITLLFWTLLNSFSAKSFPGFYDLEQKKSSGGIQIQSLDGVRGLAALMVLFDHSFQVDGIGALGVWLFFCLSGFLLATPFARTPEKAYSLTYMQLFLIRRLKRIVPMYYTFILITMMFHVTYTDIFRHLLFLQGNGHLWTIPQEMFFYLVLPVVMLVCFIPISKQRIIAISLLLFIIYMTNQHLTSDIISLYGNQKYIRPYVGFFLSGVVCSFIYYHVNIYQYYKLLSRNEINRICSIVGIIVLLGLLALAIPNTFIQTTSISIYNSPTLIGLLCSFFILLVAMSDDSILGKIMKFLPLRAVGLVGFSFYLLHPSLIGFFRSITQYYFNFSLEGIKLFVVAGITTYILSLFTYTYIERPFLNNTKKS